ncbi:MAG: carboxyl-terminal processing protease [Myxococcota bacterium]|jgi:carboxyl-terminal processing protease
MLILLLTACLKPVDSSPTGVFDYVWNDFDAMYGGFHQRDIDWDEVHDTFAPEVDDQMSDDALFDVLTGMLATLDDGHVRLIAPGEELFNSNHVYEDGTVEGTFDIELIEESYITGKIDHGDWDWYTYGMVGDGIPYLWLPGIDDNTWVIDDIADENPNAKAFIIDLRHSHGGAFTFALQGMGRLTRTDIPIFRSRSRNGPAHGDFDEWMTWELPAQKPYWDVPLIVLTDSETVSASERMLMALQLLPNTTTIGTRTNGAFANSIGRQAPNTWNYQLSVQEVATAGGEFLEGIGCPVDIELLNDPADVEAGIDLVLEAAIDLAQSGV